ncbi:DNA-directed RNA polymerase III subunit C1 (rpo31), partial [Coemansia sp. S680]
MKSIKGYVKSYSPVCYMCGTKVRVDVKWISERNCFVSKNERDNCIDELTLDKLPACLEKWVMKYIPIFPVYNDDLDDPKNKKIVRNIASLFSPEVNTYEVYASLIVLFNRQPSLVRQSILALKVKSRDDDEKVIAFNPCLCGGFNADFDGDEMNLFVTKNHDRELDMMLPQNNLMALRNGKLVIYPHQDTMLGLSFSPEFSDGNTKSKVIKYILDNYRDEDVNMLYKALQ